MPDSFSFGEVKLVASSEDEPAPGEQVADAPFRILIVADFGGRGHRGPVAAGPGPTGRRPVQVDRDDLDRVLAGLAPELHLPVVGEDAAPIVLQFRELEDFHPDRIHERVDAFRALKELRARLSNPATFAAALRQLEAGPEAVPAESAGVAAEAPGDLLAQVLEESRGRPAPAGSAESGPWTAFLARITAPYRTEAADPRQAEMVAGVDEAIGDLLREILHHPDFQSLESAWRSVDLLVRRLDTDARLTVWLLDATRAELEAGLAADEVGGPWAVIVGDVTFGPAAEDVALLGRLAAVARRAGAPFLAGAGPRFLGCESLSATPDPDDWGEAIGDPEARAAWERLRGRPEAAYLGLALPRFLLRLPYGRQDDPIESFAFEEVAPGADGRSFLWGNPAYLLALWLGQAFGRSGWRLRPGEVHELDGLPLYVAGSGADAAVLPCTGVSLSDRAAEVVLDRGLMPLLSARDRDAVRVGRFQSAARPPAPLAGRWGG